MFGYGTMSAPFRRLKSFIWPAQYMILESSTKEGLEMSVESFTNGKNGRWRCQGGVTFREETNYSRKTFYQAIVR